MPSLYLLVDIGTVLVPFIFSFHPRIRFNRAFKPWLAASLIVASIFVVWDIWFTKAGVWSFNPRYVTGIHIANLPIEEVLFFICIPFSCVFTYFCLTSFYRLDWPRIAANTAALTVTTASLILAFIYWHRMYTASSFLATAITTLILQFGSPRPQYISRSQFSLRPQFNPGEPLFARTQPLFARTATVYVVLLIPFFIVNGILTGTGPDEPVVIYNNAENLGFRLLTIPFEDIFYGFSLIGLNVYLFAAFRSANYSQLKLIP